MKLLFLFILLNLVNGCYSDSPVEKTGLEGKPQPAFNLLLMDSVTHFNTKNIPTGKPFALFFFGPECPYCRAQMEGIIEDMDQLKDIRFYMITVAQYPEIKKFYQEYKLNKYRNVTVGIDYTNFFASYYRAQGVPYMAIYSKNGLMQEAFNGKKDSRHIRIVAER